MDRAPCLSLLLLLFLAVAPAGWLRAQEDDDFGVLVMAHGGSEAWNEAVLDAVAPLREGQPLEVAFGMADPQTLQEAIRRLEARGVRRIAVVRLFVSGSSFLDRTEKILGLRPGAPAAMPHGEGPVHEDAHHGHEGLPDGAAEGGGGASAHSMALWRVRTVSRFALSEKGLAEAPEMGVILAQRVLELSERPEVEDVLILAHGPGDDEENERWLENLRQRTSCLRHYAPFRRIEVLTLREDWPEKRRAAEERIRAFVERARDEDGWALVIPFRVHGFGPYAEVLEGLEYTADRRGLLPHPLLTEWIADRIRELREGEFRPPV